MAAIIATDRWLPSLVRVGQQEQNKVTEAVERPHFKLDSNHPAFTGAGAHYSISIPQIQTSKRLREKLLAKLG